MQIVMNILGGLFEFLGGILNIIWGIICVPIYALIRTAFNLFIRIAELNLLSNTDMNYIYKRVTMIITIVMTFYVVFSIVKYTITPDLITDKEKGMGKIAYRIIGAILLIAFIPDLFTMAYNLQNRVIRSQAIPKIILGEQVWDYSSYGSSFAADTFSAFYRVDRAHCGEECDEAEQHVSLVIEDIRQGGSTIHILGAIWGQLGLNFTSGAPAVSPGAVEFDGLLALIFGCYVVYVLFLYSIDVAVRFVQLLYLQIISPVAIMGFIVPSKDNLFTRWLKQVGTTYLDLFIRISVMYFAMLVIKIIGHSLNIFNIKTGVNNVGPIAYKIAETDGQNVGPLLYIFLVAGVLIFLQRVPKLLEELFPKKGAAGIGMGLDWKSRGDPLKKSYESIKKPIAATAGAIASGASTFKSIRKGELKKAFDNLKEDKGKKGLKRKAREALAMGKSMLGGIKEGAKTGNIRGAIENADKGAREAVNLMDSGGDIWAHTFGGAAAAAEKGRYKQFIDSLKALADTKKTVDSAADEEKLNKAAVALLADMTERGIGNPLRREDFKKDIKKLTHIYAASGHTDDDKEAAKRAIAAAFNKLGLSQTEASQINLTGTIQDFKDRFDKDADSTEMNIHAQEIVHAQKVALATRGKDGEIHHIKLKTEDAIREIAVRRDSEGNVLYDTGDFTAWSQWANSLGDGDVTIYDENGNGHTTNKEAELKRISKFFAAHLGDFEKYASDTTVETQYSPEYQAANANASESSSGGDKGKNS